jgi:topoisomerase-4 subunit A
MDAMAYVQNLFEKNFLEYASYVIKDRAIPHIDDGLKPVQRRIIHSLFEMDDGKFHKVANVVGHCMKYHPHGDASIYEALVVLANKGLFLDTQGNFGNIYTGDVASAARYIETRVLPFAKQVLYRPEITLWDESYDGRNKEPNVFPAKIPTVLLLGAEGIAVGMSTKILPHNFVEVMEATKCALRNEPFQLLPDFPTGGIMDASAYADGMGKVLVRAKLDTSDPKRIVIRELPFGQTTETLIDSIEQAAKRGKLKIAGIQDFTTEHVEIEVTLARGVYTQDTVDALYAFTECESSISVNLLVIGPDNRPVAMTVTEVINYHARKLVAILKQELELELAGLLEKLHARTLERIFIEERIYKQIEEMKTAEAVVQAVKDGFVPFHAELRKLKSRAANAELVTDEDVERLLKIPIRRISLYDINKAKKEMAEIEAAIALCRKRLANLVEYALDFVDGLLAQEAKKWPRLTQILSFDKVDVRQAAVRNLTMRYDAETGYLGYGLGDGKASAKDAAAAAAAEAKASRDLAGGKTLSAQGTKPRAPKDAVQIGSSVGLEPFQVSEFDRICLIYGDGSYKVINVPEKLFVGKGLWTILLADKEELAKVTHNLVFRDEEGNTLIKRAKIEVFILEKTYQMVPEGGTPLAYTTSDKAIIRLNYDTRKANLRVTTEDFPVADFLVKGIGSGGVRLSNKPVAKLELRGR